MPGSPKGPKGKKLTKAEKEKLKKEEDDKKAKEEGSCEEDEEELRLKAEKESQERKEREQNEAEEKRRLENEEIETPSDTLSNEKERVSTAKSMKDISAETDRAPSSRRSSVARSSSKSRSGSVSSKPGSGIARSSAKSRSGSVSSKPGSAVARSSAKSRSGSVSSKPGSAVARSSAKSESGSVNSKPASAISKSGSAKSKSGSAKTYSESARSKSRSSENRSPSAKTTNETKNEEDPKDEVDTDIKQGESDEKAASKGNEEESNAKAGNKTQAEGILEVEEKAVAKSGDITQKSTLVPKDERRGSERKIVPVQKEERLSAILRREAAAKALEAKRIEEYEKELLGLLERMGGRWVERLFIGKERKRRKGQLLELDQIWENNRNTLEMEHAEQRKLAKWERYMKCDGSPDPTIQGEINTYMNLWKEDMRSNDIANVLKESRLTLSLIDELNFLIEDTPPEELLPEEITRYKETIDELQSMLHQKLELASHDLLMKATELADSETSNLQQVIDNDMICLCMWGNLSKNPRIKQFEFEKKGFSFEIPKVLCLSDCAVRALFTKFDHLSPQTRTYLPRQKRKIEEEKPAEQEDGEKEEAKEGEEGAEGTNEGEGEGAEASKEEAELEREDSEDVMAALKELEGGEKTTEDKIEEELEEDYDIKTPEPVEWEDFEGDDDAVDLRANHILGGIFHFNLLTMPHQPKQVRNWVIVQVEEPPRLNYMEYLADGAPAPPSSAKPKEEKEKETQEEDGKKREDRPPIGVTIRLPEDVYFCEEPQVVRWNDDSKEWRLDGFSDHVFNEENRILTFKTNYFGTMALIQDAHINMPFQSWEIRPHKTNSAILTIIAAIVEVEIEIKDGVCSLNIPEDRRELEHLRDVWLPPKEFIKRMRACGMNIFLAVDSSKYVSVQNKNSVTEDRLYQQMALTTSSMAYSWSKWNSDVKDDSKVVIQGTEHLEDEPLLEEDWSLFLVTKKRVTKLKMTEFDEKFSEDHAEGTEFHADLYHMATEIMTGAGKERVTNTSHAFADCVYQLLSATRVITYS